MAVILPSLALRAQDYKLGLGRAWLRYDSDSNYIRIGRTGSPPPRISREHGIQLFDFNGNHFSWSPSTGLNLVNPPSHDSLWAKRLVVFQDTGDGEVIPLSSRSYILKKSNYANLYSQWDLTWKYLSVSSGSLVASDSAWAVNDAFVLHDVNSPVALDPSWSVLQSFNLPKPGIYQLTVEYEYEFVLSNWSADYYDSISVFVGPSVGGRSEYRTVKFSAPASVDAGLQGCGYISKIITTSATADWEVSAICSTPDESIKRYIKSYRITAILIR